LHSRSCVQQTTHGETEEATASTQHRVCKAHYNREGMGLMGEEGGGGEGRDAAIENSIRRSQNVKNGWCRVVPYTVN
jgi:hypothetical protein